MQLLLHSEMHRVGQPMQCSPSGHSPQWPTEYNCRLPFGSVLINLTGNPERHCRLCRAYPGVCPSWRSPQKGCKPIVKRGACQPLSCTCDDSFTGVCLSVGPTPAELTSRQECARARDSCVVLVPRTSSASRSSRLAADLPERGCPPPAATLPPPLPPAPLLPLGAPAAPSEEPA